MLSKAPPTPQVCPVPAIQPQCLQRWLPCFQELDDRRKFLEALSEKYTVSGIPEPGPMAELPPLPEEEAILVIQVVMLYSSRDGQWAVTCSASMLSSQALGNGGPHKTAAMSLDLGAGLLHVAMSVRRPFVCYSMDQAGKDCCQAASAVPFAPTAAQLAALVSAEVYCVMQANERGRQARDRARIMRTIKRQRQLEDRRARAGLVGQSSRCCAPACLPENLSPVIHVQSPLLLRVDRLCCPSRFQVMLAPATLM